MDICLLIPLLVGLGSAILGYLLGRLGSNGNDNSADIDLWRSKNAKLETDLAACRAKISSAASSGAGANMASGFAAGAASAGVAFDGTAAKAAFGKTIKNNDLTIVEGIGPKIAELFTDHGVSTWKLLSEASVSQLQGYLDSKGERYRVHNPTTWPMQAGMANEGRWTELKKWQDEHDYGKK